MKHLRGILRGVAVLSKEEPGLISVLIALTLPVFLGMGALVVDLGMTWETRRHLQNCSDAAALAGVVELGDVAAASSVAMDYLYLQGPRPCLNVKDPAPKIAPIDRNKDGVFDALEVITYRTLPFGFAKVLGINVGSVSARAVAGKLTPLTFIGMEPFGLQVDAGQPCGKAGIADYKLSGQPLQNGKTYIIKFGPPGLGQSSGSPGNFQAPPIGNGRSDVQVLTFGWFLIESYDAQGNKGQMTGRFIEAGDKHAPPNEWRNGIPWDPNTIIPFGVKLLE